MSKNLLIVAHTPSPNTLRLLDSLLRGAAHPDIAGVEVVSKPALQAEPDDIRACDAILLFTTENLGYMSGALKDFFDRCYYPVLEEKQGLPCLVVIRAGHDGTGTRRALETILTGLRWKQVREPLVLRGEWREEFVEQAVEAGMYLAAGLEAGIF
ncbi:MAG TPA: NAD(P)H-dependent oxidoreductase [Fluviicoccus sp.]|nr:NAD(P)H-dependent oxidoreductase [Fluviicoccus sp.]